MTRVTVAYLLAFGTATAWLVWGPDTDRLWLDALIADVLATLVIFAFSRVAPQLQLLRRRTGACSRRYLAIYWWRERRCRRRRPHRRSCSPWSCCGRSGSRRTGSYGFPGLHHEDWRYPLLRDKAGRLELSVDLFAIHLIPTCQVFLGMVPVYVAVDAPRSRPGLARRRRLRRRGRLRSPSSSSPTVRCTASCATGSRARRWTAACGAGRDTPTTSGSSASGSRSRLFGVAAAPGDCVVAVRRRGRDAGDVPRRQHPDDGGAQPRAAAGLPGRHRPGADARPAAAAAAAASAARDPAPGRRRRARRQRPAHRDPPGPPCRRRRHLGEAGTGQRSGARHAAERARTTGPRDYWIGFDRYRGLDRVRTVHGTLTGLDLDAADGRGRPARTARSATEPYDVLVISTGVTNGFWRRPTLQTAAEVAADLRRGPRPAGRSRSRSPSSAAARRRSAAPPTSPRTWPGKRVDLYFPGERALPAPPPAGLAPRPRAG